MDAVLSLLTPIACCLARKRAHRSHAPSIAIEQRTNVVPEDPAVQMNWWINDSE